MEFLATPPRPAAGAFLFGLRCPKGAASIGDTAHGTSPEGVVVMHDWNGDHTTYDAILPYLDGVTVHLSVCRPSGIRTIAASDRRLYGRGGFLAARPYRRSASCCETRAMTTRRIYPPRWISRRFPAPNTRLSADPPCRQQACDSFGDRLTSLFLIERESRRRIDLKAKPTSVMGTT